MPDVTLATYVAIAISWWGSHGFVAQQPVQADFAATPPELQVQLSDGMEICGFSKLGTFSIHLVPECWNDSTPLERCVIVVHEIGHAAFSFEHKDGTVMQADDPFAYAPSACREPPFVNKPAKKNKRRQAHARERLRAPPLRTGTPLALLPLSREGN